MILGLFAQIGLLAGTYLYQKFLVPKPTVEEVKPSQPDFPRTGEGVPVALVYGKTRVRRPAIIWWGDTSTSERTDDEGITIGYHQLYGIAFGLGLHVDNCNLRKIWFGDFGVFNGNMITGGTLKADNGWEITNLYKNYSVFGGVHGGGVASGRWRYYDGHSGAGEQLESEYQNFKTAYRHQQYVIFYGRVGATPDQGFQWGYQTNPPNVSFELDGYPDALDGITSRNLNDDANPAEVIYDLLTNKFGRLGLDTARVDSTSFLAAAQTLKTEGWSGVSMVIDQHTPARDVINEILRHIDAVMYEELSDSKLVLKLIREDYTVGALDSIDDSKVAQVLDYTPGTWNETFTGVDIIYEDRASDYVKRVATLLNGANFYGAGAESSKIAEIEFPFCRHATAAERLAQRELKALTTPRARVRLEVNRDAFDFRPGDVFKWSNSEYGITDMVLRVMEYDLGTSEENRIILDCAQDLYDVGSSVWGLTLPGVFSLPSPAQITVQKTIELPQWFGYRAEVKGIISNRDHSRLMYMAGKPNASQLNFSAEVSIDAGSTYFEDASVLNLRKLLFTETADVETAFPRISEPVTDGGVTFADLRIDSISDSTALLTASAANIRNKGYNLILVVESDGTHEFMAYESANDEGGGIFTLQNVWRGLLDTAPIDHAVNAKVYYGPGLRLSTVIAGYRGFEGDEACKIRLSASTGTQEYDASGETPEDLTLVDRSVLPYPVADMEVNGAREWEAANPVKEWPGVPVVNETNNWVVTSEILTSWKERLRTNEIIQRGDDASETNEDNITYEVGADEGGGFEEIGVGETGTSATNHLQLLGDGAGSVRVRTKRADPAENRFGFTAPEVEAQFAQYRQLLINPSFDDSTDGRGWTASTGTPSYDATASSYRFAGKHVTPSDAVTVTLEQVVDVAALSPSGKDARLTFKARDLDAAGAWSVQVVMSSEAGPGDTADLDTADSGQLTPSTAYWDSQTLAINGLHASTNQIRIKVTLRLSVGAAYKGAVDDFDLRLCKNVSTQQLLNPSMGATTSWNVTNMSVVSTNRTESTGWIRGDSAVASCSMDQTVTPLPSPMTVGDVVMLRCIRFDEIDDATGEVKMEALDSSDVVQSTATTGAENVNDADWHQRELYMKIPATTTKIKVSFAGVRTAGSDCHTGWDYAELWFFDIT